MKKNIKGIALIMSLIMCMAVCQASLAEETVALVSGIATTQVFTEEPVKDEDLVSIVKSGLAAASAINQQPWYFAVVTNKDVLADIGESGFGGRASLGSSPAAVIIYMNKNTKSPDPNFDCGLACENMVIAANALGYATKIVTAPTRSLNGERHDESEQGNRSHRSHDVFASRKHGDERDACRKEYAEFDDFPFGYEPQFAGGEEQTRERRHND